MGEGWVGVMPPAASLDRTVTSGFDYIHFESDSEEHSTGARLEGRTPGLPQRP